jgi:diketogulonate reductase-like aldo/keto reductase
VRGKAVDYLDLFLIRWPLPTRYGGDYVSIGVSNAEVEAISALNRNERIAPDPDTFDAI